MMRRLRQKLALWLEPTPDRYLVEQLELVTKAARRCAHDLNHAAADVYFAAGTREISAKFWQDRADMWRRVFYPGNDGKNYRHRLHAELERLEQLCRDHGIDPTDPDSIPF